MAEECTHNCETCSAACASRENAIQKEKLNDQSRVKKVIAVVSGKGARQKEGKCPSLPR